MKKSVFILLVTLFIPALVLAETPKETDTVRQEKPNHIRPILKGIGTLSRFLIPQMKKLIVILLFSLGIPVFSFAETDIEEIDPDEDIEISILEENKNAKKINTKDTDNIKARRILPFVPNQKEPSTGTDSPKLNEVLYKFKQRIINKDNKAVPVSPAPVPAPKAAKTSKPQKAKPLPRKKMFIANSYLLTLNKSLGITINDILCHKIGMNIKYLSRNEIYWKSLKDEVLDRLVEKYHATTTDEIMARCSFYIKKEGNKAFEAKDYHTAYDCLTAQIKDAYKDPRITECIQHLSKEPIQKGGITLFGHYEQDGILENGPEPIEWIVLGTNGNKAILISKYVLDFYPYSLDGSNQRWEKSDLKNWLNNDFYNSSFNNDEKQKLMKMDYTLVDDYRVCTFNLSTTYPEARIKANIEERLNRLDVGEDDPLVIEDYILCPSSEEVVCLLKNYDSKPCYTPFAYSRISENQRHSGYWLRNWEKIIKCGHEKELYYRIVNEHGNMDTIHQCEGVNDVSDLYKFGIRPEIMINIGQ